MNLLPHLPKTIKKDGYQLKKNKRRKSFNEFLQFDDYFDFVLINFFFFANMFK